MARIELLLPGFSLATDQGSVGFCGVTLIVASKRIIVDSGHVGRRSLLLQKLAAHGLSPADIDYVFLTHAHWDHSLNLDVFTNARILIHSLEREYCRQPDPDDYATPAYVSQILESRKLQEVSDGEELDEGISVLATPGHSRGSMALLVRDGDEVTAVSGDALPYAASLRTGLPRIVFWDLEEARASIARLLSVATVFYPGHDRPFRVLDGGRVQYLQSARINISGWPEPGDDEGALTLGFGPEPSRQTNLSGRAARLRSD